MDNTPLLALISTVNRALHDQGVDPDIVTDDDKILIAIQYVETATVRERVLMTIPPEVQTVESVFDNPPRQT